MKEHVERFATLTAREREVLREVASGRINKQIAFALGISEVTVKLHRGNVMRKMRQGAYFQCQGRLIDKTARLRRLSRPLLLDCRTGAGLRGCVKKNGGSSRDP